MGDESPKNINEVVKMIADLKKVFMSENEAREKQLTRIETSLTSEMNKVKERLDKIEKVPFDPERTLVFTGIKPSAETADHQKIQNLIEATGISCTIRNVKRLVPHNENAVGIIKCELDSLEEKIQVLKNKGQMIKASPGIWVRSSKSHTDRVMGMNFQTLLTLIPGGDDFKVAGNGVIIPKYEGQEDLDSGNAQANQGEPNSSHGNPPPRGSTMRGGFRGRGRPFRGRNNNRGRGNGGYRGGRGGQSRWRPNQEQHGHPQHNPTPQVKLDNKYAPLQTLQENPTPAEAYGNDHKASGGSYSSAASAKPPTKRPRRGTNSASSTGEDLGAEDKDPGPDVDSEKGRSD